MDFSFHKTTKFNFKINSKIAVVIPAYKVRNHILNVIEQIGIEVSCIYVIDDCCPDDSGCFVENNCQDERVIVIRHMVNKGVGGAVMTGYKIAIQERCDIIVKIDGDGQMDPKLIPDFVAPILAGEADYTKGNRFFDLEKVRIMPKIRLLGNAILSFMTKLSSGYWNLFDPTNGFTAIHIDVLRRMPLDKISQRYFFETDMLFRLNTFRAVVVDVPMDAKYADEISNIKISRIINEFLLKHGRNFFKRIFYNYYLRDMSLASIELPVGFALFVFGTIFGSYHWLESTRFSTSAPTGTIILAAMTTLIGLQLILAFISYDVMCVPTRPLHKNRADKNNIMAVDSCLEEAVY